MDFLLPIFHGLDYLALAHLMGGLGFFLFIAKREPSRIFLKASSAAVLFNGLWLLSSAASMASSYQFSKILIVLFETAYGRALFVQWLLLLMVCAGIFFKNYRFSFGLALVLPVMSSISGHSAALEKSFLLGSFFDYAHFLSVSLWGGSLIYLYLDLAESHPETDRAFITTSLFSKMAMACTGILAPSGALLAYMLGVDPLHPLRTSYGTTVILKIGLFSLIIAIAAINQKIYLKQWKPAQNEIFIKKIRRGILLEWVLVLAIFIVAGYLTGMDPPQGS